MKTKQLSRLLGGSWQTPVDIGADAQNVDYSKVVNGSIVNTNVKAELDAIHGEIDGIDSAKVDVEGGSTGDLIAGKVTADNSATIAAIADIIDSDTVDEIWGRFNRLKALASAHELTQLSTVSGVHGFRYYNNELSYYNGTDWVAIAAGHDIKDESGTTMTKRDNLQFVNLIVSDDSTNNKTVVKNPVYEFNTIDEMNEAIEDGDIEDGAVIYVKQGSGGGGVSFVFGPLPASGTEGTFYFVSNGSATGTNLYDEYVWDINASRFELISSNIEIDAVPTQGSLNPVSSNGVYNALQSKTSGHLVINDSGSDFPQRSKIKFVNATITDDSANDVTVVEVEGGGTTIVQKPTVTVGTYTYNGSAQGPNIVWSAGSQENCVVTNATKVSAGEYTLTIALKNSSKMVWQDLTTADLTFNYTINKATVTVPTVTDTSKTYNGSAQHPTVTNENLNLMNRTGYEYTDAGSYTLIYSLKDSDNYQWGSGNTSTNWSIAKANQILSASPSSVTLDTNNLYKTVTISGAINALSIQAGYDASIISPSLNENILTITNVDQTSGTTNVTVIAAGSNNYNQGSVVIGVTASFKPALVAWGSGTDEEIGAMIDAYYDGVLTLSEIQSVWHIGDTRNVTISAIAASGTGWTVGESHRSQTVQMQILDFDHDTLTTSTGGKTKTLITVDTKNVLVDANTSFDGTGGSANTENGYMNSTNTNVNGWRGSARRGWCNNGFYNALPSYFKNRVKQVNKITSTGNQQTTTETTADYCYLLSEWEIFGAKTYAAVQEGTQYAWYANATANHYKMPKWSSTSHVSDTWWERSPYGSNATYFCRVASNGNANFNSASNASGLAPACSL